MKIGKIMLGVLLFQITMVSCKREGCTDSSATNYDEKAKKNDGSCIYPTPEPDPRDPYLGNYLVKDSVFLNSTFSQEKNYTLQVTTGGTISDTIYLNNLWDSGNNFIGVISGSNFSIPSQQVSGPYYATGSGSFTSNVISYQTSGDVYLNKGTGPKQ